MSRVERFIDRCEKEGLDAVAAGPSLEHDLEGIRADIEAMDPEERKKAEAALNTILKGIAGRLSLLREQASETAQKLARTKESTTACLAYLSTAGNDKRGSRK